MPEDDDQPVCVPTRDWLVVDVPDFPPEDLAERAWTRAETAALPDLCGRGTPLHDLEDLCGIGLRQAMIRLMRLVFGTQGCLDDENTAEHSGEAYSVEDQVLMRTMHAQGSSLGTISAALGRTPPGAGWKLPPLGVPTIPDALHRGYFPH